MRLHTVSAIASVAVTLMVVPHEVSAQVKITTTGRHYQPVAKQEAPISENEEIVTDDAEADEPIQIEGQVRAETDQPPSRTTYSDRDEAEPPAQSETDNNNELNLVCAGGGSANKSDVGTVNAYNSYGEHGSATVVTRRSQGFADEVRIWINDDDPRLRMPRSMLPLVRGGRDGWFKLRNIEFKEGEITATIAVSLLNNPKLRLDRYTGGISISGKAGDYTGQCQRFEPEQVERAF